MHPILLVVILGFLAGLPAAQPEVFTGELKTPFSVVFGQDGTAYGVEYTGGNRVFSISTEGEVSFIAGRKMEGDAKLGDVAEGDGGPGLKARFNGMHDLALHPDGRRLFLADTFNHRIRLLDLKTGIVSTFAGLGGQGGFGGDGGPADQAALNQPHTVALNSDGTKLLIADLGNHRVREINLTTGIIESVAGNGTRGVPDDGATAKEAPLFSVRAACYAKDGGFFIASRNGHAIRQVDPAGQIQTVVGLSGKRGYAGDDGPGTKAQINGPKHLALDPLGRLVITDDNNHCIRLYDPKTKVISLLAGIPQKEGETIGESPTTTELRRPHGARYDSKGRLWIADSMNHRMIRFEETPIDH